MSVRLRQQNLVKLKAITDLPYHEAECAFFRSKWWKTYQRLWWTLVPRFSDHYSKTADVALRHRGSMENFGMRHDSQRIGDDANWRPLSAARSKTARDCRYSPHGSQLRKWHHVLFIDRRPAILAERLEAKIIAPNDASIKVLPWVDRQEFNTHIQALLEAELESNLMLELTYFIRLWCYPSSYMRYIGENTVMPRAKARKEVTDESS